MDGVLDKKYAQERLAKKYLSFRYRERALVSVEMIRRFGRVSNNFSLVDFGAAEGLTLVEIARLMTNHGQYIGIEYDQSLVDSAPTLPLNIKLQVGNVTACPEIKNDSADAITCLAVLEHLANPLDALKEAKRILKSGGLFIATSPSPFWDKISDRFGTGKKFGGEHHLHLINKRFFEQLAQKSGLELVRYQKFMWMPIGFLPYLGVTVNPALAWKFDQAVAKIKIFDWLFVNQCAVFKKL